jgi:hypothetical protein
MILVQSVSLKGRNQIMYDKGFEIQMHVYNISYGSRISSISNFPMITT